MFVAISKTGIRNSVGVLQRDAFGTTIEKIGE